MPLGNAGQRFTVRDPEVNRAIQDLYDHFASVPTQPTTASTTPATGVPGQATTTALSISGASGQAVAPQFAFIPQLTVVPSNNPTQGAPYAQNGLLIEVNKQFYRYAGSPTYMWQQAGTATAILSDTHANRVANYPAADYPNALFLESDTLLLLESNSATWQTIAGTIEDTHANRLTSWPSVQFSVGTIFYETDRTAFYVTQNATGTVNTAGTAVTWVSGNHFINTGAGFTAAQWPAGTVITINSVAYPISSVSSSTALTLSGTGAGTQSGVAYTVTSGRWVYQSGEYASALANIPTDLGENDSTLVTSNVTLGFLFYENAAYAHQLQWKTSAWQRGPHDKEHSDSFHEFGSVPSDIGWHICDGSLAVAYLKYDGTAGTRDLPDLTTAAYAKSTKSTYTPGLTAPTVPVFAGTPATPTGTVASTFSGDSETFTTTPATPIGAVNAFTGPNPYAPSGTVNSSFTGNSASPAGTITLPGDPIENFSLVKYYRR